MTLNLTTTQVGNLREFFEICLLDLIREDESIDNLQWLSDLMDIYKQLSE